MKALSDIADTEEFTRKLRVMTPHRHQHLQRLIMSRLHLAWESQGASSMLDLPIHFHLVVTMNCAASIASCAAAG